MHPTILVVDDHHAYRSALCALIGACWPEAAITEATNGSETLELITQRRWNLLILDYHLPTLSGGDLVRRLRARVSACGMPFPPFMLMSTQTDVMCFVRVLGALGFLPKPVEPDELYAMIAPYVAPAGAAPPAGVSPLPNTMAMPFPASMPVGAAPRVAHADIERLQTSILDLFYQKVARFPPPYAPGPAARAPDQAYRVGEYLVQLGYLTPYQLTRALQAARHADRRVPLGFTLVQQNLVPSEVVATVLLQQFRDRLKRDARTAPRFMGEHLLMQAKLTPAQLVHVVQEQLNSYKYGRWIRLGDLIVRRGWLDAATIRALVDDREAVIR
jgi:CheY-like chemotaxis protein